MPDNLKQKAINKLKNKSKNNQPNVKAEDKTQQNIEVTAEKPALKSTLENSKNKQPDVKAGDNKQQNIEVAAEKPALKSTLENSISNPISSDVFSPIPKHFHRIWMNFFQDSSEKPEKYKEAEKIIKELHPDWIFFEWNDKKVLNFVYTYYPEFYSKYISYEAPIMRHDAARYLILKHFGGVFVQDSFVFQKNITPLLGGYELVFSTKLDHIKLNLSKRDGELANGIIASVPQHPFWDFLISNLQNVSYDETSRKNKIMSLTGPFILTDSLKEYQSKNNDPSIHVLHYKYLMPFYASEKDIPSIKENCIDAKNLTQCFSIFPQAFAYTNWDSSWTKKNKAIKPLDLSDLDTSSEKPLYTKLFIMNLKRSPDRWTEIAYKFFQENIKFERFQAVDGYKVKITDPETNITFRGIDVKRKVYDLSLNKYYKIICDNDILPPVKISLKSDVARLMPGNVGVWCTKVLIREEIIKNNYTHTVILEDDFMPNFNNFILHLNKFISALPAYDIAYLHNYINVNKLNKLNSLVLSPGTNSKWYGDWAHMISLNGAQKLNKGYSFTGTSDEYPTKIASKSFTKEGVDNFQAYFATYNFSLSEPRYYTGHNSKSVSTSMGCRDYHPSNKKDCNPNISLDQIYVISLDQDKLQHISKQFLEYNLEFSTWPATKGYDIQVTDLQNGNIFFGRDIKYDDYKLERYMFYKISCNPSAIHPAEFIFQGYINDRNNTVSAEELDKWCSNYMIWLNAKNNGYGYYAVFEDDIILSSDFNTKLENFVSSLPKTFDLAYLDFKLFTGSHSIKHINPYINGFNSEACGSGTHAILFSAKGIEKILSLKDTGAYKYPIDHFYFCLNTGKINIQINDILKEHLNSECDIYKGTLETYSSAFPLVYLNDFSKNSTASMMGRDIQDSHEL